MNDSQKQEFCQQSFIPQDISLEIENFEVFHEKRKELRLQGSVYCLVRRNALQNQKNIFEKV